MSVDACHRRMSTINCYEMHSKYICSKEGALKGVTMEDYDSTAGTGLFTTPENGWEIF